MPVYDYRCAECGHEEELFLHASSHHPDPCPKCGSKRRTRLWKPPTPALHTDTSFFAGKGTLLDQCDGDEAEVKRIVRAARKNGYTPNPNDIYIPTIAQKPGDPAAFIQREGGRSQIRQACQAAGTSCEGMVEYQRPERPRPKPKRLAEKVLRRLMREAIRKDPGLARKKEQLRHELIQKHALHKE